MTPKDPSSHSRASPATGSATGRLTLVTGPPGSGKSEVVLARIRDAATSAGARGRGAALEKDALLILPTYASVQHTLRSALARWEARGLFDAPFVTFTSAGERFLPGFRVRSLPSAEERDRLLEAALERADPAVFRAVAGARGFRARTLRLLKDVKQGAEPPVEALAALAERSQRLPAAARERLTGFLAVAAAYGHALAEAGLEDHEDALHRLLAALRTGGEGWAPGLLAVDGFDDFTPLEAAILEALVERTVARGGEVCVALPWDPERVEFFASAAGVRGRLLARGFVEQPLVAVFPRAREAPALAHLATHVFRRAAARRPAGDAVVLWEAQDAEDEADLVAREVRALLEAAGTPEGLVRGPRDVLLVVPQIDRRGRALEAALARMGVPAARHGTRPLAAEPWVRAGAALLRVLAGRTAPGEIDASGLLDALRWGAYCWAGGPGAPPPVAGAVSAGDVDAQEMAWRKDGFPAGWDELRTLAHDALRPAFDEVERWRAALALPVERPAETLIAALDALLPLPKSLGPEPDGRPKDPHLDAAIAAALAARRRVAALVRERVRAAALVGERPTPAEAAEDLCQALERATFERTDDRLDVVHLLDPDAARSWEAPVVFLVGLEEGGLPRRVEEDPLLGDDDREALNGQAEGLPTSRALEARERRRLLAVLTRAKRRLVLVRPLRTPEGEDLPPSPLLAEVARVLDLRPRRSEPGPVEGVPALLRCRTRADHLRFAAATSGRATGDPRAAALARVLLARFGPTLDLRAGRWRRREGDPFPDDALARFAESVRLVSPSRVNAAKACLQRHFLQRVVGIEEDTAPVGGPRFGRRDLGRLLHTAFQRALESPQLAPEAVAAEALAKSRLGGFERVHAERELARSVALLRKREAAARGPLTVALPWLERRLGGTEGIALGAGAGAFALVGQIDRVDLAGKRAVIVDYKLGKSAPADRVKETIRGTDLQLPLYAVALEREAGYEVVGLEWMAGTHRARASLVRDDQVALFVPRQEGRTPKELDPEAFRALLEQAEREAAGLVERIRGGAHPLEPLDPKQCGECPMSGPCRPDRAHLRALAIAAGRASDDDDEEGDA